MATTQPVGGGRRQLRSVTATVEGEMNVLGILGADPVQPAATRRCRPLTASVFAGSALFVYPGFVRGVDERSSGDRESVDHPEPCRTELQFSLVGAVAPSVAAWGSAGPSDCCRGDRGPEVGDDHPVGLGPRADRLVRVRRRPRARRLGRGGAP
jgi:hypothetical protein